MFFYNMYNVLDLSVSAVVFCGQNGEIGLLGMDLYFANLVEDVTYYSNHEYFSYAFVITINGNNLFAWPYCKYLCNS